MALDGSPKKFAMDVADGLISINRTSLKRFSSMEIQKILMGIQAAHKEIRTQAVESSDFQGMKEKGSRLQRLNGAMLVIRQYAKENSFNV